MAEYYFVSQLPSLDGIGENAPLPITAEHFTQLCGRFLEKKAQAEIKKLSLMPPLNFEGSNSELIGAWNDSERSLRLALAKVRAEKMKKHFDTHGVDLPLDYIKTATAATEIDDPLEAEKFLNRYRLGILEALRPIDTFSTEYIFYYGIKLMLLSHIRQYNIQSGEEAYRKIYNSILDGDRLEAI